METNEKDILSVKEFAILIGVHPNTVRNMIKAKKISAFKIGCGVKTADYRIPRSEIQRMSIICLEEALGQYLEGQNKDIK